MRWLEALLNLVYAPVCLGCDGAISPADPVRLVCGRCTSRLRPLPAPACPRCGAPRLRTGREPLPGGCGECQDWPSALHAARSAFLLHPPADRLVHQLKYRGWRALARPMAERMARSDPPASGADHAAFVVPVPTTATRRRQRGYNQAELLAREYAGATRRTVLLALERAAARATQTTLQPAARGANVAGAFRVARGIEPDIAGTHLILVDDVLTTGATATECTRTLVAAGARAVSVVTFARALDARRLIAT